MEYQIADIQITTLQIAVVSDLVANSLWKTTILVVDPTKHYKPIVAILSDRMGVLLSSKLLECPNFSHYYRNKSHASNYFTIVCITKDMVISILF